MIKKILKFILLIVALIVAYLYLAHAYTYWRIGNGNLKNVENMHTYTLGNSANDKKIIYAALGDSLTSGAGTEKYEESYPYLVAKSLAGNNVAVTHQNFSYPGARSDDLIRDLLPQAIASKPNIVTLLIGTNDVHGFVNDQRFVKNYEKIVSELTTKTKAKIYLISIPRIGSRTLIMPPYDIYFNSKITEYNNIIKAIARDNSLEYIDLDTPTAKILKEDGLHYCVDSFHPSALGYRSWAKIIYDNINK